MDTGLLKWVESTGLATTIRDSLYLFPLIESFHVIGLATLFGMIAILDFRLLGLASLRRPVTRVMTDTMNWTWMAFVLTALTGTLMFITNATGYYANFYFRAKMVMLGLTGLNVLIFERTAGRALRRLDSNPRTAAAGRRAAILSLALWVLIIFAGRWIGFSKPQPEPPAAEEINFDDLFAPTPAPEEPGQ